MDLANRTKVMQDFSDDLPVGNNDARMVGVYERGRKDVDYDHVAIHPEQGYMVANLIGFGEDDRQPGPDVTQDALQRETEADAGDADTGDQRSNRNAESLQRNYGGK